VTRWHSDVAVRLPAGAQEIVGEPCNQLFAELGQEDAIIRACYYWLNPESVYDSLMEGFMLAGYEVIMEGVLSASRVMTGVMRPAQRSLVDVFIVTYSE